MATMLLPPVNNSSPPFCCPTHIETPSYDDEDETRETPVLTESGSQCSNCTNGSSELRDVFGTISVTVEDCRSNVTEASNKEGETLEFDDDAIIIEGTKSSTENKEVDDRGASVNEAIEASSAPSLQNGSEGKTSPTRERPHDVKSEKNAIGSPLIPLLRSKIEERKILGLTRRRVRGLWGTHEDDRFAALHDDVLQNVLSFLSLVDLCTLSMVSQRWKYIATTESSFQSVDATEFVERAFRRFSKQSPPGKASRETSQALSDVLTNHTPRSLTIRNIGEKLCPDTYLPSLKGLQQLTLESFTNLTDTHIHVWMLSSASGQGQGRVRDIHLRGLLLRNCPKLSNATVGTISRHCPMLQELALTGSPRVDSLVELASLWRVEGQSHGMHRSSSNLTTLSLLSTSSLRSLDGPPLVVAADNGQKQTPRLQPRQIEAPAFAFEHSISKQPQSGLRMSALFETPTSSKNSPFFEPPKKHEFASRGPVPSRNHESSPSSLFAAPEAKNSMLGLFTPPTATQPKKSPASPFSGLTSLLNTPKIPSPPVAKSSSPSGGMFAPPKASSSQSPSPLSGMFTPPTPRTNSIETLSSRTLSGAKVPTSLGGLFAPPKPSPSSTAALSTSCLPGTFAPQTSAISASAPVASPTSAKTAPKPIDGLLVPPKSAPSSPSMRTSAKPGSKSSVSQCTPSRMGKTPTNSSSNGPNFLAGLFSLPASGKVAPLDTLSDTASQVTSPLSAFVPSKEPLKKPIPQKTREPQSSFETSMRSHEHFSNSPNLISSGSTGLVAPPNTPKAFPSMMEGSFSSQEGGGMKSLFLPSSQVPAFSTAGDSVLFPSPEVDEKKAPAHGLFIPPNNPDLEPPLSPSANPAADLESLFRPPGESLASSEPRRTMHRRSSSITQAPSSVGRLDRINVSETNVKPAALVDSLRLANGRVSLQTLECKGSAWSEDEMRELTKVLSFAKLRLLDLDYDGPAVEELATVSLATTPGSC